MKFKVGDLVWHHWTPKDWRNGSDVIDRSLMQGEITQYAGQYYADYWNSDVDAYLVKWSDCRCTLSDENLLELIPPEEHGRTEEKEDQKPIEAVSSDC